MQRKDQISELYILLGGNQGDRLDYLQKAQRYLVDRVGEVFASSPIYQTQAWGYEEQPDFLNQSLGLYTFLCPQEVLKEVLAIELLLGRKREQRWHERTMDIDVLFYERVVVNTPELIVPHPYLHLRRFVLAPLCDIAPQYIHPVLNQTVEQLYVHCPDPLKVHQVG